MDEKNTLGKYIVTKFQKRKKDLIAIVVLVVIALIISFCFRLFYSSNGKFIKVYVNDKLTKTFDLNKDNKFIINTKNGYNLLIIKDGKARIVDADCPNKICINKRTISKNNESIICLPHHVVVTVESDEEKTVDAVAD